MSALSNLTTNAHFTYSPTYSYLLFQDIFTLVKDKMANGGGDNSESMLRLIRVVRLVRLASLCASNPGSQLNP